MSGKPKARNARSLRWILAMVAGLLLGIPVTSPAQAATHKSPFDCGKTFYANNWYPGHNPSGSIDWQSYGGDGINGEAVRATAAGTARFYDAGSTSYGKWVEITHSDSTRTRYAHMSSMVKAPGSSMSVSQGTKIGVVGSTGGSSGPHLHYEQRSSSGVVDTSPTVDGVTVSLGQKKAITSSNACTQPPSWSATVDNATEGRFTASANWGTSSYSSQRYGANYRYTQPRSISDAAWFKFNLPEAANYRVEVWYPSNSGYNSAAPYIMATSAGNQVVHVDQRSGGGAWRSIGTFHFNAGDYNVVAVSRWTSGTGYVIADAVRLSRV